MGDTLPELEKSEVDEIVDVFKDVYQSACKIVSAKIRKLPGKTNHLIVSEWCQRCLERGTSVKILRTMLTDLNLKSCLEVDSVDVSHWALSAYSKSGQFRAIIRTVSMDGVKGTPKYYLEIWSEGKCNQTFDLPALDEHGAVYTDDWFGSLSWSSRDDKVIYIAEQKEAKTTPFYQQKSQSEIGDNSKSDCGRGEQYAYEDDWGEVISPKRRPVIVSCDINKKSITVLGTPKDFSPAQVIYEPNGDGVVGVAFINTPRKLGLIYCTSRQSHIFYLSSKGDYVILSDENVAVQSPRFSPDGKYLVWLQRPCGGAHHAAHSIIRCNWNTKETTVIVDVVQDSIITKNGKEFFGIFNQAFVTRCWTSDSKWLLFSTPQKYRVNTYAVDIEDGNIWDIGSGNQEESTILLDVSEDNYAILNATSFKQLPRLSSLHLPSAICDDSSAGSLLTILSEQPTILDKNIISNFTVYNEIVKENCFATYYGPQNEQNGSIPLILYPHGGPHAAASSAFSPAFHLFSRLGFGILIVHFHGSTGIGQKFVDSLLGKIGCLDAEDCYFALQTALEKFPWLDANRVVLFGGSHGGFLVTHLSSQYPLAFTSVVAVNPVTNLPSLAFITDIPDWAVVESGYPYEGLTGVVDNPEVINKMMELSPIRNIKNVKAPTLLLLGKKDLRVPPSQGLAYYNALKEINVPTKVFFYEDNHSLGTVPVEMDSIIHSVIWFKRCLKRIVK